MAFFLQLHLVLIFLLFLREYFGNQASLTNCSGTLIQLTDSTASAPPVRRNKGSFQRVSFLIIHMSWVIFTAYLSFIFPWYFPEKSGTFCLFFVTFQWILFCLIFSVEISFLVILFISLIYSFIYSYCSFIYSYISLFFGFSISLFLFLILSSCLAVLIYYLFRIRYFVKLC